MNKSNRFSLLLVDDEPWALSGMEEIIPWEEYGFEIVGKCSTASEALRLLGEKKPQAVFTDIRLPDYSGLELNPANSGKHGPYGDCRGQRLQRF